MVIKCFLPHEYGGLDQHKRNFYMKLKHDKKISILLLFLYLLLVIVITVLHIYKVHVVTLICVSDLIRDTGLYVTLNSRSFLWTMLKILSISHFEYNCQLISSYGTLEVRTLGIIPAILLHSVLVNDLKTIWVVIRVEGSR